MTRRTLAIAALVAASGAWASGERIAGDLVSAAGAPGAVVASWDGGGARVSVAGVRAIRAGVPVEEDDLWHIGSLTKSMTATLVARLAEAGEISWDDTVGEALADLPGGVKPAYRAATYADLLAHRSGLPANLGMIASLRLAGTDADRDVVADRRRYAAAMLAAEPAAARGTFLYSNAGYVVAGAMLEAATGESWEALVRREVFAPLGMDRAGFGPPGSAGTVDQPRGHRRLLGIGPLRPAEPGAAADNIPALGPAGRVHASGAAMLRYLAAHATRDPDFLRPESWARLHTPPAGGDYALGWRRDPDGRLTHDGSNTMWYARATIRPGESRAVFIAVNRGPGESTPPAFDAAEAAAWAD